MGIFNILLIYFAIFQPDPNVSYAMTMGQLLHMPYSSDINFENHEINTGVDISAGYASSIIMAGAPGITYRQRIGDYITGISAFAFGDAAAFSLQVNKDFSVLHREIYCRGDIAYLQFYELSDRYRMYSGNTAIVKPFLWGNNISPFIGAGIRVVYTDFPHNISSDRLNAGMHLLYGITADFSIIRLNLSNEISRSNTSLSLSLSFVW